MKPYTGTQAVVRALRLLRLFENAPELTSAEVLERSGLNRTTAFRLLTALASEGMVALDAAGERYRLGPAVAALARSAQGTPDLRAAARPELVALAERTQETATLETLLTDQVVVLDGATGSRVLGALPWVGTTWPAHATSSGKVLLAALPRAARAHALAGRRRAFTPRTITERRALGRALERVRASGLATAVEELEAGYVALAVPVADKEGGVIAALSLGGPKERLPKTRFPSLGRELRAAAARITERL